MAKEKLQFKHWLGIGILALVIILIISTGSSKKTEKSPQESQSTQQQIETIEIVFDIPSLIDKDISEIKSALGNPSYAYYPTKTQTKLTPEVDYTSLSWSKNDYELQIDFYDANKPNAGKVKEMFLSKNTNSKDELIKAGNLIDYQNSPYYSIQFQKSLTGTPLYTGTHIYPK